MIPAASAPHSMHGAIRVCALVLMLVVVSEVGMLLWLRATRGVGLYRDGSSFATPAGYTIDGRYVSLEAAACYVIRVTSDTCPYCRQDLSEYQALRSQARSAGCAVVEVAPTAGDIAATDPDRIQLQFINLSLAADLIPYSTPQTLIVGGGTLRWHRLGSLRKADIAGAIELLRGFRRAEGTH